MAKILIIGGHGKIALLAEPMLRAAGHEVTAAIRNPDHSTDVEQAGATAEVADVENMDQRGLDDLVDGYDVVVWSAGAGGGDPARTRRVDEAAASRVLVAVERTGARFLMVSYFGSRLDHDVDPNDSFFTYAEAKARVDAKIRDSQADWVIIAPSKLTLEPEGGVDLDRGADSPHPLELHAGSIPRATVARIIAELVERPGITAKTIWCNGGNTAVSAALDDLG
ncbi:NAD(P)H-binding protein [Blastococcus sp. Marseille-P5729]|uniref:NAD(P)H-binding protein n=1 Tax=Blastococcus sp. Marseille-P5729 TaxID=2086582 RepID=UPI000D10EDD3|nr:NAD(P)H-binding protein [Blastococcus sp. Marseille-P5729]